MKKEILELEFDEVIKNRILKDGIYEISEDIVYKLIDGFELFRKKEQVIKFADAYSNFVVGSAYGTGTTILLSKMPLKLLSFCGGNEMINERNNMLKVIGSGFNYGSTNLISNCPKHILILAEDD